MHLKVRDFELACRLSSRHRWSHFRIHRRAYYTHLVWGRLSILCGFPGLEEIDVCKHCSEEISRVGEDYLNWCEGCQQLEGDTETITLKEYEARHG